jgi:hypothetical protein
MHVTNAHLAINLSRELVAQSAPEEIPMFGMMSEAYLRNPSKALKRLDGGDEMLGFGMGVQVASLVTPVILVVVTKVLDFIRDEVTKAARQEGTSFLKEFVQRLFRRLRGQPKESKPLPRLTPEMLAKIRQVAEENFLKNKLSKQRASTLADALVGGLVLTAV